MRKLILGVGVLMAASTTALAHDTVTAFGSRGECEAALAKINKEDADFLLEIGEFEKRGDAMRWFHEVFRCEQRGDSWYITFVA